MFFYPRGNSGLLGLVLGGCVSRHRPRVSELLFQRSAHEKNNFESGTHTAESNASRPNVGYGEPTSERQKLR